MPRAGRPSPASTFELRTERLLLRPWRLADRAPFAALNADPTVMEFFPATLTKDESDALAARIDGDLQWHGYGLWAVEIPGEAPFIGFVGLSATEADMPFPHAIEVGWRLARAYWGRGLASEAARAALAYGFDELGLEEIVSLTAVRNVRSRRVMERLGMSCDPAEDFTHPDLPAEHPLAPHVLYRLAAHARA